MQMMTQLFQRGIIVLAVVVCALSVPVAAAQAASVNYVFTGSVDHLGSGYSVSGSFRFDNETSLSGGAYPGAVKDFTFKIIGGAEPYTPSFTSGTEVVTISNNTNLGAGVFRDRWALETAVTGNPIDDAAGPITPFRFDLRLDDRTGSLFSNTDLQNPPTFASLAGSPLTSARWRLFFEDTDDNPVGLYVGAITSLTAVPLPAAVLLFGAGLISLVGLGAGGLRNLRTSKV
jgi:hypothetical protein